jgi:hypothetical protein
LLVRVETQLPGFGGLYIANGAVRVYMKTDAITPAIVRNVLSKVYSGHPNLAVRDAMANVGGATVMKGQYALSELIAIQKRVEASIPGWTGAGTNIMTNKVVVAFPDSDALMSGLGAMEPAGVPVGALTTIIMPRASTATVFFTNNVRPTRAGIFMTIANDTYEPHGWKYTGSYYIPVYYGNGCTLGFNVHASSGDYFLTAGHCQSEYRGVNGITGDSIFQPSRATPPALTSFIGTIAINPAWPYGAECPPNGQGGYYDFCTDADVALGQYTNGFYTYGERKIGISLYGGINGNPGTNAINNWYPITRVLTPEYVDSVMRHETGKSAGVTYTTSGPYVSDMMDVPATMCWPLNHLGCFNPKTILLQNQTVIQADVAGGDSGGAVFTGDPGSGAPYAALGIVVAQIGRPPNLLPDHACPTCRFVFSRWSAIESRLGTLNPKTVLP